MLPHLLATLMVAPLFLCAGQDAAHASDPRRQFDFWLGCWQVQNRHLQPDGTWLDGTVTRARITPVCNGQAVLEEWAGPFRGTHMNGFSLRSYDPAADQWSIVLYWTTDGRGSFGVMNGDFRHGRGEFGPRTGRNRTRYTFSDALRDSVRWDSATTVDGGQNWRTDWIMEFSRTAPAAEASQDSLFEVDWNAGSLAPPEARVLDGLLGSWAGVARLASGEERRARLRSRLLNRDCLVLDTLMIEPAGDGPGQQRLAVRGLESGASSGWTAWYVDSEDSRLRRFEGLDEGGGAWMFRHVDPSGGVERIEFLNLSEDGQLTIEELRGEEEGEEPGPYWRIELTRESPR